MKPSLQPRGPRSRDPDEEADEAFMPVLLQFVAIDEQEMISVPIGFLEKPDASEQALTSQTLEALR